MMKKYQDTPMDLADASLIAVAESMNFRQIFTIIWNQDTNILRM
jgi:hypothetical protein